MTVFPPPPDLAALARPHALLCLQVARFIQQRCHITLRGCTLLLAVSGGADSMALLSLLTALRQRTGHELCVMHIDHGLRPESPLEAASVAALCAAWGISCTVRTAPVATYAVEHTMGTEESGRHLRYALLEAERQRMGATWIVTGHHREDLSEDIIMRLTRGTGWPALGGMTAVDARRHLLRPLLLCAPTALRALLLSYGLHWHEDASNADTQYSRNRIRHNIMPLLQAENPSLHQSMENIWSLAREDALHWETILATALQRFQVELTPPTITLPAALLRSMDKATRLRVYMKAVHHLEQGQARATTLFQLDKAWHEGRGGTHFQLHGNIVADVGKGDVIFRKKG